MLNIGRNWTNGQQNGEKMKNSKKFKLVFILVKSLESMEYVLASEFAVLLENLRSKYNHMFPILTSFT